jgi:plastocyanin
MWTNSDDIPQTVVSTDRVLKANVMVPHDKFYQAFTKVGTYPYYCSVHPKMNGKVAVQSGATL